MALDLYLDSSALVMLYVREPETAELSAFVRKFSPPLPFSSLHELELTHALERRREEGDLSTIAVNQIVAALDQDLTAGGLARARHGMAGPLCPRHPSLAPAPGRAFA